MRIFSWRRASEFFFFDFLWALPHIINGRPLSVVALDSGEASKFQSCTYLVWVLLVVLGGLLRDWVSPSLMVKGLPLDVDGIDISSTPSLPPAGGSCSLA